MIRKKDRVITRACTAAVTGRKLAPPAKSVSGPEVVQMPSNPKPPALSLEDLAGEDPQMLRNVRSARRIVDTGVSVLIQGATGSGKEAFAHAMHAVSSRAAAGLRRRELRGDSGDAHRERAVRLQAGRVHRCAQGRDEGQDPAVLRRHAVPRRDRRHAALVADPPAARSGRAGDRAARKRDAAEGRSARRRRVPPQPARDDRARRVPRRPLLPARTASRSSCRVSRIARTRSA